MPLEDFLTGCVLFALMALGVLAATALVVHRRLPHLGRLDRTLAAIVTGTAILVAVHLVPLALGILSEATLLVATALAVLLAARVAPAPAGEPEERAPVPPSGRVEWALAGLASAVALTAAVADLRRWAANEIVGVDPLTFHLPNVGRWIQTGSMWQIDQFVPLLAHGNYPNNGDVVMLSTVLPWHNDFLVRAPIVFYLGVTAVAVLAVARELRAPAAASVLAAAALVSVPIVGLATIPRALPDSLLWATFTCGVLFLLRHARSGRRSDLMLAATALAIAFGTKWYGISSVAMLVAIWTGARLAQRDVAKPRALGEGVLLACLAGAGDLAWMARNVVESHNPFFPAKLAAFGVTLVDAPRDVIVEAVGFSIVDYLGDPPVLGQLAGEIFDGLGVMALVCVAGLIAAAIVNRRPVDRRIVLLSVVALALVPVYAALPGTALGNPGDPSLASVNTRYAIPSLLLAAPVVAWAIGRLPRLGALGFALALAVSAVAGAYSGYEVRGARDVVLSAAGLVLLAAAVWSLGYVRRRPLPLVAAATAVALLTLAGARHVEQRVNVGRYVGSDPAIDVLLRLAPSDRRIGLAADWSVSGLSPIWPSFGTRIGNEVEYVGYFDGFLRRYPTEDRFHAALERGRYDFLVVGRGFYPPQPTREQRWAMAAGWRTVALSTRLRVLAPPARVQRRGITSRATVAHPR
jgi:hypothetical protein